MGRRLGRPPPSLYRYCPVCGHGEKQCDALKQRHRYFRDDRVRYLLSEIIEMLDRALAFDPLRPKSTDELRQSAGEALAEWKAAVKSGDLERAEGFEERFVSVHEKFKTQSAEKEKENPNLHLEF